MKALRVNHFANLTQVVHNSNPDLIPFKTCSLKTCYMDIKWNTTGDEKE